MNVSRTLSLNSPFLKFLRRFAVGLLAFVTIFAPAFSHTAGASPKGSSLETFAKLREAWVQDLRTKQLEPILKLYAADAAFLQPNGERLTGSAALRTLFQTIMASFNSDHFEESLTNIASGAKITSKGSYIIIYKRQPNGTWQIVQHVWTGTPPPGT
jgi:ketosteroid isomerase-like protein